MKKLFLLFISLMFVLIGYSQAKDKDTVKTKMAAEEVLPTISLSSDDFESSEESQDLSSLLQSSRDVFTSTAGYSFGSARFRIRGYESNLTSVLINGVPVNDIESGSAYFSNWGGLNDAVRNTNVISGLGYSNHYFGRIGGLTNINARASDFRKQTKVTYSAANRSYRNRIMFIHSTGMMDNGWAFTLSGSRRWSEEGYVTGTSYNAWSYFLAAEKRINAKHSLYFTGFGAPAITGRGGVATQEAYDLSGSNYYNPYWGYQNGEVRNSRMNNYHKPMFILNHEWKIDDKSSLNSAVSFSFGRGGSTSLNWFSGNDPRPDYYRNLPSNYLVNFPDQYESYLDSWVNDPSVRQLNWEYFYRFNMGNLDDEASDEPYLRSNYIIEERRNDHFQWNFNTVYKRQVTEELLFNAGLNVNMYKGHQFKVINDLLGGDYYLDIDKYADRDFLDPSYAQSDLNNPDNLVKEGDIFGYYYIANVNVYETFAQAEYSLGAFDLYAGIDLSLTNFWRTGKMKKGLFPDNSYGEGEKHNFFNYAVKGGATYKIDGRNFIQANAAYETNAPFFRNAYMSPRTRDGIVPGLESNQQYTADLSYLLRAPSVKVRFTGYYSEFLNMTELTSVYFDDLKVFGNYITKNLDLLHYGLELGADIKLTQTIEMNVVMAKSVYKYNSRPLITIYQDNDASAILEDEVAYIKNYKVPNGPQTAASIGFRYNAPKYWFVGANANYYDDIYVDFNPYKRTENYLQNLDPDDMRFDQIIEQERLPWAYTIDVYGGKSWKIKEYFISLNANISNVLNNTNFAIGGFEQYRSDPEYNPTKFPNKYFYMYGTTFFINLNFRF